jgi:pimeloyl-ACP methyl ester carboxylesterase/DNA-binding CsgD family transcriptional regulator
MNPEVRYAKSEGLSIAYQVVGHGPIDLVFVMGWVSNIDAFWEGPSARFLDRLASFSRLILFDKRGTGLSDRVSELPTIEQRMDDVRAVMDAAGSRRAALLGISEGAAMCACFAATYPERTVALAMYGAYAKRLWDPEYPWAPTMDQRREFFEAIEQRWGGDVDLDILAPSAVGDTAFHDWWARYLQQSASPGAALALAKMNTLIDIRHVLPAIRVPTLILHRTGDLDIDVGGARFMAEKIAGARYVELPGNDHLVFAGDQEAVLGEIEQFLTGIRPAPAPDTVLATILFAEIVEAMVVAATIDDSSWRQMLSAFDRILSDELVHARGQRVRSTPTGLVATFDGPARAIQCAVAIVDRARTVGLDVRAGLHSGECERAAGEIRGVAYQVASRVMSHAHAGEVLLSGTITDLVAGSDIRFKRLDHRLATGPDRYIDLHRVATRDDDAQTVAVEERLGAGKVSAILSPRELEVALLVGRGLTNRMIADELSISVATVERHTANIFNKLGLHSRSQVAVWAVEQGLLGTRPA